MEEKNREEEYITREDAEEITDIQLQKQLYEHIEMLMDKLNLSEIEAGKLLDVEPESLLSLRFNSFMVDTINEKAKEVVEEYIEKKGLKKSDEQTSSED